MCDPGSRQIFVAESRYDPSSYSEPTPLIANFQHRLLIQVLREATKLSNLTMPTLDSFTILVYTVGGAYLP